MRELAPLSFAWLRVAGSAVILNLAFARQRLVLTREDKWRIAGLAMLGIVLNQAFFLMGLARTSTQAAAVLNATIGVFALAAAILLRYEKPTLAKIGGIALALTGALLVVGGEGITSETSVAGSLLVLANCVSYALYLVLSKPFMGRHSPLLVVTRMFALGTLFMLPMSASSLLREDWSRVTMRGWLALAFVIVGPSIVAYSLNAWALRHTDSSLVAAYTYAQPILAALLGAIFLDEAIRPIVVIAAGLIFAGVWLTSRRSERPRPPQEEIPTPPVA